VGRRRYFRIALDGGRSAIGVVYPSDEESARRRWLAAHRHFGGAVRLPAIVADDGAGRQIVEDLGSEDLASRLATHPAEREDWIARAVDAGAAIADLPNPGINPAFDAALFRRELALAREAVFDLLERRPLSQGEARAHDSWADALVAEILRHPVALCHRDFHANNLFPSDATVGVIDFQDARLGPDTYDLASLLWERTTLDWMDAEFARTAIARWASRRSVPTTEAAARLDRVLLQRAWKVCGTFARAVAEGRGEIYRRYLPGELALVRRLLTDRPDDRRFAEILSSRTVC
jgi:aminoglycoside/choline kinase family phosphotransferase